MIVQVDNITLTDYVEGIAENISVDNKQYDLESRYIIGFSGYNGLAYFFDKLTMTLIEIHCNTLDKLYAISEKVSNAISDFITKYSEGYDFNYTL